MHTTTTASLTKASAHLSTFFATNRHHFPASRSAPHSAKGLRLLSGLQRDIRSAFRLAATAEFTRIQQPQQRTISVDPLVPGAVRRHIATHMRTEDAETYTFVSGPQRVPVTVTLLAERRFAPGEARCAYLEPMAAWLHVAAAHATHRRHGSCARALRVTAYLTSLPKQVPGVDTHVSVLGPEHANTAFATACAPSASIVLFRREEWFKVFVHETFHAFGLDFSSAPAAAQDRLARHMRRLFHVSSKVNAYEAYTEFWAEMVQLLVYSSRQLGGGPSFETCLRREQCHSLFQLAKILAVMKVPSYADDLASGRRVAAYQERTNILSYYVLKTVLLLHATDVVEWCAYSDSTSDSNDASTSERLLAFSEHRMADFGALVERMYRSPAMLDGMRAAESFLAAVQQFPDNRFHASPLLTNMRMSIHELIWNE